MPIDTGLPRAGRWYVGVVSAVGLLLIAVAVVRLSTGGVDLRWLAFAALTAVSASVTIKVPALPARISISETFVFASLLVFGPYAGMLTVAIDGLVASLWIHRRKSYALYKTLFNMTAPTVALWCAWRLSLGMAPLPPLIQQSTPINYLLPPLFVLALLYFAFNSWLMAFAIALQTRVSPLQVWSGNFLWVAINYLGGASVSVLLILLYNTETVKAVSLGIIVPLLTVFYLMFKIGMGRAEDSIAHLTAMTQAADERARLEAQLREAHKMESVGRLAAGLAHDFDHLLAPIAVHADTLLAEPGAGALRRAELEQIKDAVERARNLTRQLLALGRQQALALARVELGEAIASLEPLLRRSVPERIDLRVSRPASPVWVRADLEQIEQALYHLAANATDAMPAGGELSIAVGETLVDADRVAREPGLPLGPCVTVTVRDTGLGMDEETRARICEPFFTTKEARIHGTGLGLAIVYGVVKQHGGHLTVDSVPGQGSTFTIVLPADGPAAAAARQAS